MNKIAITQAELKLQLDYDQATGVFRRKAKTNRRVRVGDIAGGIDSKGYLRIRVNSVRYMAHRLAWLYVFGSWPNGEIDHIDGCKLNNSIINLRDVSASVNMQNRVLSNRNNSTGLLGVAPNQGKFQAQIRVNGKHHYLGRFNTAEEAYAAYVRAKQELHLGFVESRLSGKP